MDVRRVIRWLGALALAFAARAMREAADGPALVLRHQRAMLAGYFYLLTVLSLVHVRAPSTNDGK